MISSGQFNNLIATKLTNDTYVLSGTHSVTVKKTNTITINDKDIGSAEVSRHDGLLRRNALNRFWRKYGT